MYGLLSCLLVVVSTVTLTTAINCGFPGRPAYGYPLQSEDKFIEGALVGYACNPGYYMVGKVIRRCLPNGTWTVNIPVCDTTLSPAGYTSCSEALTLYPPELAVDNNKKTCFYSNRRKPRWWRMDMGFPQNVISVAITVPFASSEHHFTIYVIQVNDTLTKYQKCVTYRGIFSSQTLILGCGPNMDGIRGSVLHIQDDSEYLDHFGLCEVEVFVRKDHYECGEPEVPTNAHKTTLIPNHSVKYECFEGYKLEGSQTRQCLRNGQWSGSQPICRQIICPPPIHIENGQYRIISPSQKPVLGSKVVYTCNTGFMFEGINDTLYCTENGLWIGIQPMCKPVDCGDPSLIASSEYLGGKFLLLNHSTKFMAIAELICFNTLNINKKSGILITCREDGSWSELDETCKYNKVAYYKTKASFSSSNRSSGVNISTILVSACMAVLSVIICLVLFLFKRRILQFKWASEPMSPSRRPSWALDALRGANIQIRKPFRIQQNCPVATQSIPSSGSVKSGSSKFENVYEEIANITTNPMSEETEDKIRRAAMIAAELAVINEQKQCQMPPIFPNPLNPNPLNKPPLPQSSVVSVYAKIDIIQKHKDRLLREQQRLNETRSSQAQHNTGTDSPTKLYRTLSSPDSNGSQSPDYEPIRFCSLDLGTNQTHLLKDNMIFVNHPAVSGVTGCDNLSQVTQSGNDSNLKRIYSITS